MQRPEYRAPSHWYGGIEMIDYPNRIPSTSEETLKGTFTPPKNTWVSYVCTATEEEAFHGV